MTEPQRKNETCVFVSALACGRRARFAHCARLRVAPRVVRAAASAAAVAGNSGVNNVSCDIVIGAGVDGRKHRGDVDDVDASHDHDDGGGVNINNSTVHDDRANDSDGSARAR